MVRRITQLSSQKLMAGRGYASCAKNEQLEGVMQSVPKINGSKGLSKLSLK